MSWVTQSKFDSHTFVLSSGCYRPLRPYRFSNVQARSAETGVNQQPPVLYTKYYPSLCIWSSPHSHVIRPKLPTVGRWAHVSWLMPVCHQLHLSPQLSEHPVLRYIELTSSSPTCPFSPSSAFPRSPPSLFLDINLGYLPSSGFSWLCLGKLHEFWS